MNYITIQGFEDLTPQQIFDTAARHIGKTRKPSVDHKRSCVYSGCGCNAAPFILPELREKADEEGDWLSLIKEQLVPYIHKFFMQRLQTAHDYPAVSSDEAFISGYLERMQEFAEAHQLDITALREAFPGEVA